MLLDTNIIIYAADEANEYLREFIETISPAASDITRIEVLGYHKITNDEKMVFLQNVQGFQVISSF